MNSLFFKVKDNVDADKHRLIEIFFKDWVDDSCNNQVQYKIEKNHRSHNQALRVDFERQEDALALCLRGVPVEFQNYLEIIR